MKKEQKLSVCIIAKNEESMLHDCLKSVENIADEIILVDTGSTDRTKEIAANFNAKIYDFPWNNSFADARNVSLEYANYEFILIIDADERLTNPNILMNIINNASPIVGGWIVSQVSLISKNGIDSHNLCGTLRLFRRNDLFRFRGIIHEQIINSIVENDYKIEYTEIELYHYGYNLTAGKSRQKQMRNCELLEKWVATHQDDTYSLYQLGLTYYNIGRYDEAEIYLSKALKQAELATTTSHKILNYLAMCAYQKKNYEVALEFGGKSIEIQPHQVQSNFIIAEIHLAKQEFMQAIYHYNEILNAKEFKNELNIFLDDITIPEEAIYGKLGQCYLYIGNLQTAIVNYQKGLEILPTDVVCLCGMAEIAFENKQHDEAKQLLEFAYKHNPHRNELLNFIHDVENSRY